jgi:hypothetical protein
MGDRYRTADGWAVEVVELCATPDRSDGERGLIERIPRTHRYQVIDTGLRRAMFLTRVHPGPADRHRSAQLAGPCGTTPGRPRLHAAIRDLTRSAGLAA